MTFTLARLSSVRESIFIEGSQSANCVACGAIVGTLLVCSGSAFAIELAIETGPSTVVANRLQRPMTQAGTRFDATADTGRSITPWRVEASWGDGWWGRGGRWRASYVPLRSEGEGLPLSNVQFGGATFVAGQPLGLRYQFDTWRLGYSEPVGASSSADWSWRLGGTLAIRNARIRLVQGNTVREFNNVGPVPLARIDVSRPVGSAQQVSASVEGFPAPGGGGLLDGAVRWGVRVAPDVEFGLFFREQVGAAVDRSIFNRLQVRTWGVSVSGQF